MFTYINPVIREQLIEAEKLIQIDQSGKRVDIDSERKAEKIISLLGPIPLPMTLDGRHYQANWYAAVRKTEFERVVRLADELRESGHSRQFAHLASSMAVNSILIFGDPAQDSRPLVRVHSNCLTGDVFGSDRCDCGPQLAAAAARINDQPHGGMIVYMAGHEGRGIGLWAKAATYLLQDSGENTYQANERLGLPVDSRDFSDAAAMIRYFLGDRPIRLLTNNPKKHEDLTSAGIADIEIEKHICGITHSNQHYLRAKKDWGHFIVEDDISGKSD